MQYHIFWLVSFHFKSTSTNIAGDPTEEGVPPGEPVWDVAFSLEKNSWISRGVEIVKVLPKRKTPRVAAEAMRRNQRDPRRRLLSPLARRTQTPLRIFEILQSPLIRKSMAHNFLNGKKWQWLMIKGVVWLEVVDVDKEKPPKHKSLVRKDKSKSDFVIGDQAWLG